MTAAPKTALITGVTSQNGSYLPMQIRWEGEGVNEVGYWLNPTAVIAGSDPQSMNPEVPVIRIDPRYFRPTEVETLLGDPTKAKQKLGDDGLADLPGSEQSWHPPVVCRQPEAPALHGRGQLPHLHEANYLKLDISKAKARLGWQPRWALQKALHASVEWHQQ